MTQRPRLLAFDGSANAVVIWQVIAGRFDYLQVDLAAILAYRLQPG